MTVTESFLLEFESELLSTRRMLEHLPDGALDYKPHEKSMSMSRLAGHIAEMPGWGVHTAEQTELDIHPPGGKSLEVFEASSRAAALEVFDQQRALGLTAIGKLDDDAMHVDWTLRSQGRSIFTMPRIKVLRSMILNHIIHHRGQLSVYLRLNGQPVPGMYGPSADEQ